MEAARWSDPCLPVWNLNNSETDDSTISSANGAGDTSAWGHIRYRSFPGTFMSLSLHLIKICERYVRRRRLWLTSSIGHYLFRNKGRATSRVRTHRNGSNGPISIIFITFIILTPFSSNWTLFFYLEGAAHLFQHSSCCPITAAGGGEHIRHICFDRPIYEEIRSGGLPEIDGTYCFCSQSATHSSCCPSDAYSPIISTKEQYGLYPPFSRRWYLYTSSI